MSISRIATLSGLALSLVLNFCPVSTTLGSLVWRPGEGWTDEKGGDISASSSKDQLDVAKRLEEKGDYDAAFKAYKGLVRRWPLSFSAPEAQFKVGMMQAKKAAFWDAYKSYQRMIEKYPSSTFFEQAIEEQFRIGNLYLAGEPQRLMGVPMGPSMEKTAEIFQAVIKNAPYGKFASQAQFKIGMTREKQKKYSDAVQAYNDLIAKYPGNDLVDDAAYQIGYAWMKASSDAEYDQSAAEKAVEAFQDFLVRYPSSEKAAQAEENIATLHGKQTQGAYNIAKFYESQSPPNLKAAYIYYNEVVRQNPDSEQAQLAKKRIEALRPMADPTAMATAGAQQQAQLAQQAAATKAAAQKLPPASPTAPVDAPAAAVPASVTPSAVPAATPMAPVTTPDTLPASPSPAELPLPAGDATATTAPPRATAVR